MSEQDLELSTVPGTEENKVVNETANSTSLVSNDVEEGGGSHVSLPGTVEEENKVVNETAKSTTSLVDNDVEGGGSDVPKSWIASHALVVGGVAVGACLLVVIIVLSVALTGGSDDNIKPNETIFTTLPEWVTPITITLIDNNTETQTIGDGVTTVMESASQATGAVQTSREGFPPSATITRKSHTATESHASEGLTTPTQKAITTVTGTSGSTSHNTVAKTTRLASHTTEDVGTTRAIIPATTTSGPTSHTTDSVRSTSGRTITPVTSASQTATRITTISRLTTSGPPSNATTDMHTTREVTTPITNITQGSTTEVQSSSDEPTSDESSVFTTEPTNTTITSESNTVTEMTSLASSP